jgi:uncharacterized RDD family membrane protein YckC
MSTQVADPASATSSPFAGFWKRVGALIVDALVLASVGLVCGLALKPQLVALGGWGRVVGFVVAAAYFGLCGSRLTNGQTVGKRLLKIRVVDRSGAPLSPVAATLRFLPLGLPFFLNKAPIDDDFLNYWVGVPVAVGLFGLGFCAIYLLVANGKPKRTTNDLLVGSYVVLASTRGEVSSAPLRRVHIIVCLVALGISAALPVVGGYFKGSEPFQKLGAIRKVALSEPWVRYAEVRLVTFSKIASDQEDKRSLDIKLQVRDPDVEGAARVEELARKVLESDPDLESVDAIRIETRYGYDLGIASYSTGKMHSFVPEDL